MFKRTLLMCAVGFLFPRLGYASDIESSSVEFDSETLKSLGIDPALAGYFAKESRFMPGDHAVTLKVNGVSKGNVVARFVQNGELCFDKSFMEQAELRLPYKLTQGCYDYLKYHPQTVMKANPGQELVELIVPPQEIDHQDAVDPGQFVMEGTGAALNYTAMSSRSEYSGDSTTYSQLQLDGGVNVAGWLLRSQQLFSHTDGRVNSENGQTYLQRTSVDLRTTARVGEVNMNNGLLEGSGIYGVTLTPESALQSGGDRIKVSGIANTSQARVEIRQQGVLVSSILVPVGPFTITDVALRNYTSDLTVTVIETDGNKHSYVVPASLYMQRMENPAGLFVSVGQVSDEYDKKPVVASVSGGWRLLPETNASAGVVVAQDFQAAAAGLDTMPWTSTLLSLKASQSWDRQNALQGQSYGAEVSIAMALGVSITASSTYYSRGYREFSQFLDKDYTPTKKQEYSVGLQWQSSGIGSFNASYYETRNRTNEGKNRYITAGWGGNISSAYVSANWQRQLDTGDGGKKEDMFYLNVTVPLGQTSVNTYARRDSSTTRFGTTASGNLTEDSAYTLGAEIGKESKDKSLSAGLSTNLHYAQLALNGSMAGQNHRNYTGSLQGGIVAHSEGITLSPLPVRETFGVASLAQPVAGVKIDTPQGPVWTDARGYAVLPSLNAWKKSRVEVNTETLPKNMDIGNGTRMLSQGRGSVSKVKFNAITQRRVLLNVTMADDSKLPKNLAITDEQGNYLTTSVDEGVVFLNNATSKQTLVAQGEPNSCRISLVLPERAESGVFYETAKGVCQ